MNWTPELEAFVASHLNDDTSRLLLSARRYPGIDVPAAVQQIEARRQIRTKLPEWYADPRLMMGGRLAAEQCSSERTARYKRSLVCGRSLCDLTGGMGVDFYYMSQGLERAVYVEHQPQLCEAARHNLAVLGATHAEVCEADAVSFLASVGGSLPSSALSSVPLAPSAATDGVRLADTIYLDPARRAADGSRVYDLRDCEPDVVALRDALLRRCARLVVKVSPMADLSRLLEQLPGVAEVHVVAVRNECKEVLLVLDADGVLGGGEDGAMAPRVCCVDFLSAREVRFAFGWEEEAGARSQFATEVGAYLYEPDVTLLKAGAFRVVGQRFGLEKLDVNSHLYTSDRLASDFPGRVFAVGETIPFHSRCLKTLKHSVPQANISARNFPLSADSLRARTGIRDGGETYLFASRMSGGQPVLMRCRKALLTLLLCLFAMVEVWAERKPAQPTFEESLTAVTAAPLARWEQGKQFVCTDSALSLVLQPEDADAHDSVSSFSPGSLWRYHSIVMEENWLGQQVVELRFLSGHGRAFRFETGQSAAVLGRDDFCPQIPGLGEWAVIRTVDSLLRARTLYRLVDDERILPSDSLSATLPSLKFCPVTVDSVSYGNDAAPLRVWFRRDDGGTVFRGNFLTALPDSRQAATATPLQKFFSVSDPYLRHPDIAEDVWTLICRRQVRRDMTAEEVRLSLGRPSGSEQIVTRQGLAQLWTYRNGLVLEFLDGRLRRVATEP